MAALTFTANNINEIMAQMQEYIEANEDVELKCNFYLLPQELADRWRVQRSHLENIRVKGSGPAFMKLSDGPRAKVRYPLFGKGGVLCLERDRARKSTMDDFYGIPSIGEEE